jgi:hypothetical protein
MNPMPYWDISTRIEHEAAGESSPSALQERRRPLAFYKWPALFALMFTVPTSANVQITQPLLPMNQTCISKGWRSRREEESSEAEFYAPFEGRLWEEDGPLRIPISRYVRAKVVFLGPLKLLPLADGI